MIPLSVIGFMGLGFIMAVIIIIIKYWNRPYLRDIRFLGIAVLLLLGFLPFSQCLTLFGYGYELLKFSEYIMILLPFVLFLFFFTLFSRKEETLLVESEERYRILVEESNDGIFITDGKKFLFVNERMMDITGYTQEELLSINPFRLIHPQEVRRIINAVKTLKEQGSLNSLKSRILRKDKKTLIVLFNAKIIRHEGKLAVMGTIKDITDFETMQNELLKQEKLKSLTILAGGIAHDFNNFLTGIMGNLSILKMEMKHMKNREIIEILDEALEACEKARGLTAQLMNFTRSGTPVKEATSIEKIIKESAEFSLRGSKSRCEFHFQKDLPIVRIDPVQISQVIQNLVINASQAMPEGGVVRIYVVVVDVNENYPLPLMPGKYIKISIVDNGKGIPEEHLGKIFDPFFTTKEKGSGLGLSVCYRIVKNHNGHIEVESEEGKGTAVHVYLPLEEGKPTESRKEGDSPRMVRGKVLVMDDEELVRDLVKRGLEKNGISVDVASDGEEAVQNYRKALESGSPYNAVLLDLTVPGGMGGVEAARMILKIHPEANLIVSSGYSDDIVLSEYTKYGFKACLPKPYTIQKLIKTVEGFLSD
ncbi:MAG TPA: PAS domain S-box protein [candidate division WOR-3 bacterium]|uniref:histidine kinase n=1 Tax=candidate division WOR-3 bacterium TaxID=2052148 RepID=A0A7C0ZGD7_UNCW3|nr:PAS domain S-box protein [candidate division WOR-3 bacterium]